MDGRTAPCPRCGVPLPENAAFCPFCAESIRPRRTVNIPSHRRRKRLRRAAVLAALVVLAAALYDCVTPDVYDRYGELTYTLDGNDYHLAVTFRNDPTPEVEYTVPVEAEGRYDRASKLFITHVDTGVDAGRMVDHPYEKRGYHHFAPEAEPHAGGFPPLLPGGLPHGHH